MSNILQTGISAEDLPVMVGTTLELEIRDDVESTSSGSSIVDQSKQNESVRVSSANKVNCLETNVGQKSSVNNTIEIAEEAFSYFDNESSKDKTAEEATLSYTREAAEAMSGLDSSSITNNHAAEAKLLGNTRVKLNKFFIDRASLNDENAEEAIPSSDLFAEEANRVTFNEEANRVTFNKIKTNNEYAEEAIPSSDLFAEEANRVAYNTTKANNEYAEEAFSSSDSIAAEADLVTIKRSQLTNEDAAEASSVCGMPAAEASAVTNISLDCERSIREVTLKLMSSENLTPIISIKLNNFRIDAIVDTAAQVTVVNNSLYEEISGPIESYESIRLKGAGNDQYFEGKFIPKQSLTIGNQNYLIDLYVAPISDDIILGADFLIQNKAKIDFASNKFRVENNQVPIKIIRDQTGNSVKINQVYISKHVVIPPNSVKQIRATAKYPKENFLLFESTELANNLLIPRTLVKANEIILPVTNLSDCYKTLKKDKVVGTVFDFDNIVTDCPENVSSVRIVKREILNTDNKTLQELKELLPVHVQDLFIKSCKDLSLNESRQVAKLLFDYQDIFAKNDLDLGTFHGVKHKIDTGDAKPIRQRMRRTPLGFESEEEKHLQQMLKMGVIRESNSEWASPPVLVRKKDGTVRWCVDYRALNNITVKDAFPLPRISECIDALHGSTLWSTLDLQSGYWQVELDSEEDMAKTAFITKFGLFEHTRLPFGLCNSPATFSRAIQLVLRGIPWSVVLAYLDDVVVIGKDFESHIQNLKIVFDRFRKYDLKLKARKCALFQTEILFLGRKINAQGVQMTEIDIDKVRNWSQPLNNKELQQFLGYVNYHRDFIKDFALYASPLYDLVNVNQKHEFQSLWLEEQENGFQKLKELVTSAPCLAIPNDKDTFVLDTDASLTAIGGSLSQIQNGKERLIAFASHVLTPAQQNYCATRRELLAVIRFVRQYRHYLLGRHFYVRTDHNSLAWLLRFKNINGQLARWLEELSEYNLTIVHRRGIAHENADGLSRLPDTSQTCNCYMAGVNVEDLPCAKGGQVCKFCQKVHKAWAKFEEDVDYVLPLAFKKPQVSKVRNVKSDLQIPKYTSLEIKDLELSWFPKYTKREMRDLQLQDPVISPLLKWLETDYDPEIEIHFCSPGTKHFWACRSQLEVIDGILYYIWENPTKVNRLLLVPESLRKEVFNFCHDASSSGHLAQKKTLAKIRQSFIWHGINKDCKLYITNCSQCNTQKKSNRTAKAAMMQYQASAPMERVHIDILGPFNKSKSGNVYILMLIDQFTKWLECFPLPDQTAETIAKKVVDGFISRFGCPLQIFTDQGKNFDGNLFAAVCSLLEITKMRTTPYHPAANGQIERYNRTILQMIRCKLAGNSNNWDCHLQQLAGAIRSTPHDSLGFSPNMLMLGREVYQPSDLIFPTFKSTSDLQKPVSQYVEDLRENMMKIHHIVRSNLKFSQNRQKRYYDARLNTQRYEKGDVVYRLNEASKIGESNKLKSPWEGPYLVVKVKPPTMIKIFTGKRQLYVHHNSLKISKELELPIWLLRARNNLLNNQDLDQSLMGTEDFDFSNEDLNLGLLFADDNIVSNRQHKPIKPRLVVEEVLPALNIPVQQTRTGRQTAKPRHLADYTN